MLLSFATGVAVGVGLSGIALYGATKLHKPLSTSFTVNTPNTTTTIPTQPIRPAQIITRRDPLEEILKQEHNG